MSPRSSIMLRTRIPVIVFCTSLILVIKADLDFVATNWNSSGFDLWEEVYGAHFYTRLVRFRENIN